MGRKRHIRNLARVRRATTYRRTRQVTRQTLINPSAIRPALIRRAPRKIVKSHVSPRPTRSVVVGGALRSTLQTRRCIERKAYKKTMLRKVAAQVQTSGGRASLERWRRNRAARTNIVYRC